MKIEFHSKLLARTEQGVGGKDQTEPGIDLFSISKGSLFRYLLLLLLLLSLLLLLLFEKERKKERHSMNST